MDKSKNNDCDFELRNLTEEEEDAYKKAMDSLFEDTGEKVF